MLVCGLVEGATGELYEDDGETADWRGTGGTLIRFRVRDGEIAITQEGEDAPFVDRIAIRRISDDI